MNLTGLEMTVEHHFAQSKSPIIISYNFILILSLNFVVNCYYVDLVVTLVLVYVLGLISVPVSLDTGGLIVLTSAHV